jgi:hypothetical protein
MWFFGVRVEQWQPTPRSRKVLLPSRPGCWRYRTHDRNPDIYGWSGGIDNELDDCDYEDSDPAEESEASGIGDQDGLDEQVPFRDCGVMKSNLELITPRRNFLIRALAVTAGAAMTTPADAAIRSLP